MSYMPNPGTTLTESAWTYVVWRARTRWTEMGGEGLDPAAVFYAHVLIVWVFLRTLSRIFPRLVGEIHTFLVGIFCVLIMWLYLFFAATRVYP